MSREFKGRVIISGEITGVSVVSHEGVNTLATFQKSVLKKEKTVICADQNNKDLYKKEVTNKILCLPKTIGSTTGGMVLQTVCQLGIAPSAMLFSEQIDSLAAAGVILSDVWTDNKIVAIDRLGKEFLEYVKDGMKINIKPNGSIIINE